MGAEAVAEGGFVTSAAQIRVEGFIMQPSKESELLLWAPILSCPTDRQLMAG
jgi:hypothetical protein